MSIGEVLELSLSDGSTVQSPTINYLTTGKLISYSSDQAYVDAKGSAATDGDVYENSTSHTIRYYNGTAWTTVGSSGSSGINYITNFDAELNTTGWATYADTSASTPVDGTGGSPLSILSRSTSSPLRGSASFLFTKSGNSRGEGFSYDLTIDSADKAKVLQIEFDYAIASGTYADGDLSIFIFDVTNSQLIQPSASTILNAATDLVIRKTATFQTNSNSNSYRLIVHVATTSSASYSVKFDNFKVGPQVTSLGPIMTAWKPFVGSGSWVSNITYVCFERRLGDSIDLRYNLLLTGAPNTATLSVNLPPGRSIDIEKYPAGTNLGALVGTNILHDDGTKNYAIAEVKILTSTSLIIHYDDGSGGSASVTQSAPFTFAASDEIQISIVGIPILGWDLSTAMSSDAETRVSCATYVTNSTQSIPNNTLTIIDYEDKVIDSHNAVTVGASWKYIVQVPGTYFISAKALIQATTDWSIGESAELYLYKNGSRVAILSRYQLSATSASSITVDLSGDYQLSLVANDYLDIRIYQSSSSGQNLDSDSNAQRVLIHMLSGPSQIAASETCSDRYTTSAGQSIPSSTVAIIDYDTKDWSSHGSVTTGSTWKFTAPISGIFDVAAICRYASASMTNASNYVLYVYKNGSVYEVLSELKISVSQTFTVFLSGSTLIKMLAGDYIDIRTSHDESTSRTLHTSVTYTAVKINRVGNY